MCGIVGYSGPKDANPVLLVGLHKLEYRGYDSAGLAILNEGELIVSKSQGKIAVLEELVRKKFISGHTGIGHTRWATHGEPTTVNAHPHTNREHSIAVVHNGIIENYLELKNELAAKGYVIVSETDTEVIPHLIDSYQKEGLDIQSAFLRSLHRLEGKFALAMVSEQEPDKVFFAKNGAPLIVAQGEGSNKECFLTSDLPAVVPLAKQCHYLQDQEWGYLEQGNIHLFDWNGKILEIELHKIILTAEDIGKGDFPHFMLKEIHEQAAIVEKILAERVDAKGTIHFDELKLSPEYLARVGRIIIQASGTSLNAGLVGKLYLEQFCRVFTDADFSSEFRYRNPVIGGDTLVMGISQSGETADTIAGLHEAKSKFLKVLSLVNNTNSTMARESDAIINILAGPEIGVASTKAYTSQLVTLFLLSLYIGSLKWVVNREEVQQLISELQSLPEKIRKIISNLDPIHQIANRLKEVDATIFLGRTFNYATALEGALKLKEISYIHASGYAGGEFKHGPIALVSEGIPIIVVAPEGEIRVKTLSNLMEVKARKGTIISIITEGDEEIKKLSDYYIEIPPVPEALSPILTVIPLQLISYYTAVYRNCDVDKPRNLAKSVTVE